MTSRVATQLVGTITVSATGSGSIIPVKSNTPFKNLSLTIRPINSDTKYIVSVYLDGELSEQHTYPDENDRVVSHMMFPNTFFPANIGTGSIPKFCGSDRRDFTGLSILIQIENLESEIRVFEVYSIYESWDSCRFGVITQES